LPEGNNPPTITSLTPSLPEPQNAGTSITWTCEADDESPETLKYKFLLRGRSTGYNWLKVRGLRSSNTWTWETTNNDAATDNHIKCTVKDEGGKKNSNRYKNYQIIGDDITRPSLTITSPSKGEEFTSSPITVSGTASDNVEVRKVQISVNGGKWKTATGTLSWSASVDLTLGENTIRARAFDTSGNKRGRTITVTYNPP
jgi:hypothetical protein